MNEPYTQKSNKKETNVIVFWENRIQICYLQCIHKQTRVHNISMLALHTCMGRSQSNPRTLSTKFDSYFFGHSFLFYTSFTCESSCQYFFDSFHSKPWLHGKLCIVIKLVQLLYFPISTNFLSEIWMHWISKWNQISQFSKNFPLKIGRNKSCFPASLLVENETYSLSFQ